MNRLILLFIVSITMIIACKPTQQTALMGDVMLDEIDVIGKKHPYRPSETRKHDLLHTSLDVSFDWENQHLHGKATLTLKPFFYQTNEVVLDAKGMELHKIQLVKDSTKSDLDFSYNQKEMTIIMDKIYTRDEEFTLYIEYTSKPNELEKAEGLEAITDDKGLYFINPLGEEKDKPRQIWTQGEPESNSVWFPTIDHPNERCSQEIRITIENNFIAMSNGTMISDTDNGDGTHTTYWKQDKPHAPYLFMMTIGEFAEIKDEWNGMSVNYYVEQEYAGVAQRIFGKTPRMITFFSDQLGVDYPWDKYWQVCVRDYVSGAMENTSSVIFGEFVQRDERELLDEDYEDIVSHELYHHWFGDLVTCESWANLPLNESFATYGEVLWREHEYGDDARQWKVYEDMQSYFAEAAQGKQVDMIRYRHDTPEDMFDSHSYAKGGTILNMLREVVGDDAFFASLKKYLNDNKFSEVEIHELRIAFEDVTGEDLNWFFDQWFLSAGHPELTVDYTYTEDSVIVNISQYASAEGSSFAYRLPMHITIHEGDKVRTKKVVVDDLEEQFAFAINTQPDLVNVDASKTILAIWNDNKTNENWIYQYNHAFNFMDKLTALEALYTLEDESPEAIAVFQEALQDDYWYIRQVGAELYPITEEDEDGLALIMANAQDDESSAAQSEALYTLAILEDENHKNIFEDAINHQSYMVNAAGLEGLSYIDPEAALAKAEEWETIDNYDILDVVGYIYAEEGEADKQAYFTNLVTTSNDVVDKYYGVYYYSKFLQRQDKKMMLEGISFIEEYGKNDDGPWSANVAKSAFNRIKNSAAENALLIQSEMNQGGVSKAQKMAFESEIADMQYVIQRADEATENVDNANK
ncbi:MAG: M1 family metallopeptidase [Chitinophagales bacterium]